MDKPKVKSLSAEEKKKTAEAIKNKPESGKKTPPPPVSNKSSIESNLRNRGSLDDATAWLQERFKE